MAVVVERSFTVERGSARKFEQLSREGVWPYMEARGCKILGLFVIIHGGPSDEIILLTAYDSMAHWESTRDDVAPPPEASAEAKALYPAFRDALLARRDLTKVSSTRVLRPITDWVQIPVHPG
ncbi:MAG: NIPSNAP family protein [Chloroflexi bacterium]|nr:NIPSNAP family protein [Chloroflexota bacterium]